jgi:hypothetical protein
MFRIRYYVAGIVALLGWLHPTQASIIYGTGFENPPFAAGSQLVGQDGWVVPDFLSPNAAIITNAVARSGSQSVQIRGADLVSAPQVMPDYDAVGSYRRPVNYDASSGTPIVLVQADVRLDGATLGSGDSFTATIAARSGNGGVGELGISSDGFIYGYNGNFGSPLLFSTAASLGDWYTLGILLDFAADTFTFLVNGVSFGTFSFEPGFTSDVLLRGSMVVYARPDTSVYQRQNYVAYYDNFSIRVVPEPSAFALTMIGVVALAGVCRLKQARRDHRFRGEQA